MKHDLTSQYALLALWLCAVVVFSVTVAYGDAVCRKMRRKPRRKK